LARSYVVVILEAQIRVTLAPFEEQVDLAVGDGEVVAVLGPNGSGKTTLLRTLAGIQPISSGRISLDGTIVDDPSLGILVAPGLRPCGLVFQDHLLFPHLSVLDNVAFGPRCRGMVKSLATARAHHWLDRLSVAELAGSRPSTLSGGQSQRVALARVLATEPRLLLLDEPTAALDVTQRSLVRSELRAHLANFGGACIMVTHDPLEAAAVADRLVVLEAGRIVQTGTFADVHRHPRTPFVAELMGRNLLRGEAGEGSLPLCGGPVLVTPTEAHGARYAVISPSDIVCSSERPSDATVGDQGTTVVDVAMQGDFARVRLGTPDGVNALMPIANFAARRLNHGATVWASVDPDHVDIFDPTEP
jgi:molybdate transport system ATP-binding protein